SNVGFVVHHEDLPHRSPPPPPRPKQRERPGQGRGQDMESNRPRIGATATSSILSDCPGEVKCEARRVEALPSLCAMLAVKFQEGDDRVPGRRLHEREGVKTTWAC